MDSSMTDVLGYLMSARVQDLCGRILASLERRETRAVEMMAVSVRNRHYVLLYNPDWVAKAHYDDVVMTVRHEAYHIIFEHIPRHLEAEANVQAQGNPKETRIFHTVSPFASDLAANSLLIDASGSEYMREHRDEWVLPKFGAFKNLEPKRSYEWYLRKLSEQMRKKPKAKQPRVMTLLLNAAGFDDEEKDNQEMFTDSRDQEESGETGSDGREKEDEDEEEEKEKGQEGKKKGKKGKGKKKQKHPADDWDDEEDDEEDEGAGAGDEGGDEDEDEDGDGKGAGSGDEEQDEEEDLPSGHGFDLLKNHRDWMDKDLDEPPDSKNNLADELRYEAKTIVKHAVEEHEKSHGTIPAELQEVIKKLLREPQVPWTRIFRNVVASAKRTRRRRTIGRPRRRHIAVPELIPFPGKKKDYSYHVAFCIDTSASMGSHELEMGLNELEGMRKLDKDMTVTVIECDAAVERVYELGSEQDAVQYDVHGRGGTSFTPALLHAQKLNPFPDAVFYFTDGYAPAPTKESRVPCMFAWIITPNGKVPDEWGLHIQTHPYV